MPRGSFLEEAAAALERYYLPIVKQEWERSVQFLNQFPIPEETKLRWKHERRQQPGYPFVGVARCDCDD